jgi:outer membrane protein assembly factor BamD
VNELEASGVQGLPPESPERINEPPTRTRRQPAPPAVQRIAHERKADVRQMHPDLVRAARLQLRPHECVTPEALQDPVVSHGIPAITADRHAGSLGAVTPDRLIHSTASSHDTGAYSQVMALDLTGSNGRDQRSVNLGSARDHQQSAGVLVEPVHDPGPGHQRQLRVERQQRVLQGICCVASAWMHDLPRRLVHDEQCTVFEDNGERQNLRNDPRLDLDPRLEPYALAASHLVPAARLAPVDQHRPVLDPGLKPGTGVLRQRARQSLVQPQTGQLGRQVQLMAAELAARFAGRKCGRGIRYTFQTHSPLRQRKVLILFSLSGQLARAGVLTLCLIALAAGSGCRSHRAKDLTKSSPELLYKKAHKSLVSYDYQGAIKQYEALTARFPFTDQARQARLDLIYAYYRAGEGESATDAADTFIRENPTHPRVDYAWYVKGMVDFERTPNAIERLFRVDLSQRPPSTARKSFSAFRTVVEQYPKSEYAHDALQRMIYLRNRLADYEVHVARYYYKRGAYVAAAQRAKGCIDNFDGAPALREALQIMIQSYDRLGLQPLAEQSRQVYELNYGGEVRMAGAESKRRWWQLWH